MLRESKLPAKFYNEAQLTAVYLHNRQIHGNDTKTPFEHIYGKRPNLSHLRPFGCVCYSHIPIEKRTKLDDTTEKCRLIGYGDDDSAEEFKGYKLLVESNLQIIYNKNVTFPETMIFEEIPNFQNSEIEEDDLFGDPNFTFEEIAENEGFDVENINSVSEETAQKVSKIMETYLGEEPDTQEALEFLCLAEGGEVAHYEVLQAICGNFDNKKALSTVKSILKEEQKHLTQCIDMAKAAVS